MENRPENNNGDNDIINAIIAIVFIFLGAVALGLSFTKLGTYSLIAGMLLEVIAITFVNLQRQKKNFKWLMYIKIAAYALFVASIIIFAVNTVN